MSKIDKDFEEYLNGSDWFCDNCGAYMNWQIGFTRDYGVWTCSKCGYENDVSDNNLFEDEDFTDEQNIEMCHAMDEAKEDPEYILSILYDIFNKGENK